MANEEVKRTMRYYNYPAWKLADYLGCSTNTVYRRFQHELPPEEQQKIIDHIKEEAHTQQK